MVQAAQEDTECQRKDDSQNRYTEQAADLEAACNSHPYTVEGLAGAYSSRPYTAEG